MRNRKATLHGIISEGENVALTYTWEAEMIVDGAAIPRGKATLEAAAFFTVRDGKIVKVRE